MRHANLRDWLRRVLCAGGLVFALALVAGGCGDEALRRPNPEPIVPTRTPDAQAVAPSDSGATSSGSVVTAPAAIIPTLTPRQAEALGRVGVAGALEHAEPAARLGLRFGHIAFWRVSSRLPAVPGLTVWQTVRLGREPEAQRWPAVRDEMADVLREHPGEFWLVGNEPDVVWQDNVTAETYAEAYHDIYTFIKERDPTARVAAGGIALPTPLRLAYLEDVLEAYQTRYDRPMPVDVWAIHLFVLREELGSWGIAIPPGMSETSGELYEIADHGDIERMKAYVGVFRDWMAARGYEDKPLAVTEFGILLPEDYGFPPEFVQRYMIDAFDYFRTAAGPNGLKSDGGRLVQYAFWYSLYDDGDYPTGNLFDAARNTLTPLGEAYLHSIVEPAQ